ncbi:MAG TPA: TRAP transporter small permease [Anaerohalosphaeraceae bacterium]|mgnify:CR=1 FL=1|jgi:TRAP-type C4-dicarboxylate transport system permease small subunit|nr:TRAP transporter small permease [Anaerohalosphaeraceae bacterium]HRT51261.1 TRAP transporter small permease [Anaerohalosphaeraceae bacterium]HRT87772.1 TRAP transporter small permease [Anaerohalosphaeraceae bacterium]
MLTAIKRTLTFCIETLLTVVMTVLVLDVVWQVFTRQMSNLFPGLIQPSDWTEELATFLMMWVGMLGASVALNRGAHLGIDFVVSKFSLRGRLMTEIFSFACIGLFSLFGMFIGGLYLVGRTLELGQTSPALKIPMGYVYLAVPISGFFLVVYSFELLAERVRSYRAAPRGVKSEAQMRSTLD